MVPQGVVLIQLVAVLLVGNIAMVYLLHHEQEEVDRKKENKKRSIKSFFRSFRAVSIHIEVKVLFFRVVERCRENVQQRPYTTISVIPSVSCIFMPFLNTLHN